MNSAIGLTRAGSASTDGLPGRAQVPRLRAGLQERSDDAAYRRAKGGSDFDPKHRSSGEVRRFCQSFMTSCTGTSVSSPTCPPGHRRGRQEIGYLFGQYKRITNQFLAYLQAKAWSGEVGYPARGDRVRAVYFAQEMLATRSDSLEARHAWFRAAGTWPSSRPRS